ncbi:MAG: SufD family Fe-S cluster assembly protein [Lachnospiraceae bacterium]|nr:SufD family Fe-S cluster assembly protein [Lachnospiraceae bacterium]
MGAKEAKSDFELKLNCLPTLTWNQLRLNRTDFSRTLDLNGRGGCLIHHIPAGVIVGSSSCQYCPGCRATEEEKLDAIQTGMGKEAGRFFAENSHDTLFIRAKCGNHQEKPLRLNYELRNGDGYVVRQRIIAEEGSELTVIMDYTSDKASEGFFGVETLLYAAKGATINLVKLQLLGRGFTHFENIGAVAEEGAKLNVIQMILGGKDNYAGLHAELLGKRSCFEGNVGYLCLNDEQLDMNYYIGHIGKKTQSSLKVEGALRDRAVKTFRGTIDLKRGAKGACGDEQEGTLLLSEEVRNKTLPIILCDEDDVEGTHGASIGRLSADTLFYMQSRGIDEKAAELLMTRAKLNTIQNKIGDEESVGRLQHFIQESFDHEY